MSGVQGIRNRGGKAKNLEKREWGGKVEKESKTSGAKPPPDLPPSEPT
jgi:hypothetical protein